MHKFKLVLTGPGRGEVFMDGKPMSGVVSVSLNCGIDEMSQITLKMNTFDVEVEAGVVDITAIGDDCRRYALASEIDGATGA